MWSFGWMDKEPMSCSLTLQKFLPGGLRVLSDSAWYDFGRETKNIEAQMAVWIQPAKHKSFSLRAPSVDGQAAAPLHFLLHAIGEFRTLPYP